MNKAYQIFLNTIPVWLMIALIPVVENDYLLTALYILIIAISLIIKRKRNDLLVMAFGALIMIVVEYFFISTGAETFERTSLFGIMPVWLPFLWGYGFIAIKRSTEILDNVQR